jgi:PAS domain S-box-containing protein/putative nucleotidyltransferase with HDIG domain
MKSSDKIQPDRRARKKKPDALTIEQLASLQTKTHEAEDRFQVIFDNSPDGMVIIDPTENAEGPWLIEDCNKSFCETNGYERSELIGKNIRVVFNETATEIELPNKSHEKIRGGAGNGKTRRREYYRRLKQGPIRIEETHKRKDGSTFRIQSSLCLVTLGGQKRVLAVDRDITEDEQAEEMLRASEARYHRLFEAARDGILILDAETGMVVNVNPFLVEMLGYSREQFLGKRIWELGFFKDIAANKSNFEELQQKEFIQYDNLPLETAKGRLINVEFDSHVYQVDHDKIIQCNIRDTTERKRAEKELITTNKELAFQNAEKEKRAAELIVANKELAFQNEEKEKRAAELIVANKELAFQNEEKEKRAAELIVANKELTFQNDEKEKRAAELVVANKELAFQNDEKEKRAAELVIANKELTFQNEEKEKRAAELIVANKELAFQNEEKEKRAAELSTAVQNLKRDEDLLRETGAMAKVGGGEINPNDMTWRWTEEVFRIHELEPGRMIPVEEGINYYAPDSRPIIREAIYKALATGEGWDIELPFITAKGKHLWVRSMGRPEMKDGKTSRILSIFQDITERKRVEMETVHRLQNIQALHAIDQAISGSLDLNLTLSIALDQVVSQLNVDAADVLLLNPHSQTLEYIAGRGFRSKAIEKTHLRLSDGLAGLAALERRLVSADDLRTGNKEFVRAELLAGEDFHSYHGVPLITKGQVKGVLEVFQRSHRTVDDEWLSFLETLGGQVAIAVDSASLFIDLQRSNIDLFNAFDSTIEGWSHALDLRDKETEDHTLRVTEMTLRLARAAGMTEEELVHVRRGALLHDIGKMGVPDNILLKPDKLTDEEWVVMRKHPTFAFELLSPIAYLQRALDIPYCHHEKWDGMGYPRGLKGEQIPLMARIFAVADVWDALTSDRPYRKAWPRDKALQYIREQSGKYFDPHIVKNFLEIVPDEK